MLASGRHNRTRSHRHCLAAAHIRPALCKKASKSTTSMLEQSGGVVNARRAQMTASAGLHETASERAVAKVDQRHLHQGMSRLFAGCVGGARAVARLASHACSLSTSSVAPQRHRRCPGRAARAPCVRISCAHPRHGSAAPAGARREDWGAAVRVAPAPTQDTPSRRLMV